MSQFLYNIENISKVMINKIFRKQNNEYIFIIIILKEQIFVNNLSKTR